MRKRTDEQHTNDKNKRNLLYNAQYNQLLGGLSFGEFFFLSGGILEDGRRDERRKGRDKRERKREGRRRRGLLLLWVTYNLLDASYRLGQGKQQEQEDAGGAAAHATPARKHAAAAAASRRLACVRREKAMTPCEVQLDVRTTR